MAITAQILLRSSAVRPSQFDAEIVDPEVTEDEQKHQLLDYIDDEVLPGAKSEVSVPFREATGYGSVSDFVEARFSSHSTSARAQLLAEGEALFDAAVKSYARSEINKVIATEAESYDRDSDQDRIQGNQRLEKLLKWAATAAESETDTGSFQRVSRPSMSVPIKRSRW